MDRLTDAELATMRAEHTDDGYGFCTAVTQHYVTSYPCHAARLLHDFAPGPVPHLAGIAQLDTQHTDHRHEMPAVQPEDIHISTGLFGPTCSEELAR